MSDGPFYITASILYPNANPHVGHALELCQADFLARYQRLFTESSVRFQIGNDEHGLKIQRAAEKEGQNPADFVNEKLLVFQKLAEKLHISHDQFVRTTSLEHKTMAQAFWRACQQKGDIYKKTYRAWYNVKQEEFLGLADEIIDPSVFGIDPQFLELIEEENYFFAASKYTDQVLDLLKTEQYKIIPKSRYHEIINFVESKGLQDISISRDKNKLAWGIPVPDDDTQVIYVWFDALINYLTGAASVNEAGEIVPSEFWPAHLHCVGKDISRFHALLWPAMLFSAGLACPKELLVHGFILSEGKTMSKSTGNVVDPLAMIAEYGTDTVRWYLLSEIPTTGDGDFTVERLREIYSSDLANDYGNLVSRVLTMCQKYVDGKVPVIAPELVQNLEEAIVAEKWREYHIAVSEKELNKAIYAAKQLVVFCNRRIEEQKPWVMAKEEKTEELAELLYELLEIIRHITVMLQPVIPATSNRVMEEVFLGENFSQEWGGIKSGAQLGQESLILFPRKEKIT